MKKSTCIIWTIIFTVVFAPLNFCFALHDNEAIGKGGAWESDDMSRKQPAVPDNEKSIEQELDKAFKKSLIVIPEPDKEDKSGDSEESGNKDSATDTSDTKGK
jgi:hypothetical protein